MRVRSALAGNAVAIACSQAITAGGSLVLQIVAARGLGVAGYGAYALCIAMLTMALALYTGYVGDGLTVLDRHDPTLRGALVTSSLVGLALAFLAAFGMILVLDLGSWRTALAFAAMIVAWLVEETGRRILIARLQLWSLVANDGTYMAVTLVVLGVLVASGTSLSLTLILGCTAIGCAAAVLLGLVQIDADELRSLRPHLAGSKAVGSFAVWRSLQTTLRPLQLFAARLLLLRIVSLGAVGAVEAGRLVVAPILTLLNGASAFLLSSGAHDAKGRRENHARNGPAALALTVITGVGGAFAALLSHPLGRLMAGRPVPHLLVLGWTAYLAMWAASLPFTAELVVRTMSWPVFLVRLAETVVGLGALAAVLLAGASADWVPWVLAVPAVVNTWTLRRLAVRSRPPVPSSTAAATANS